MTRHEIDQRAALLLQLAAIGGNEPAASSIEVRWKRPRGMSQEFFGVRELKRAAAAIENLRQVADVYVGAAPRVREAGTADAVERVWCLWADLDGQAPLGRLRSFEPLPSIVIRSGSDGCAHAWWPLRRPISPDWAQRANRRLALALGADRASTDPARILRPANTLSYKHDPPRPVVCTRLELDVFTVGDVVGGLPDDPAHVERSAVHLPKRSDAPTGVVGLVQAIRRAQIGNRNNVLYWAACCLRDDQIDTAENREALRQAALEAGLGEHEIDRTIASAETKAAA